MAVGAPRSAIHRRERPGGGGNIGIEAVVRSPADGGFNGSAGSSFDGSTTPTISSALSSLPASLSSSNNFETGSSYLNESAHTTPGEIVENALDRLRVITKRPRLKGGVVYFRRARQRLCRGVQ